VSGTRYLAVQRRGLDAVWAFREFAIRHFGGPVHLSVDRMPGERFAFLLLARPAAAGRPASEFFQLEAGETAGNLAAGGGF
jgi:hypothetical protein